jgi:membrane-associated phospholipid phosphatase
MPIGRLRKRLAEVRGGQAILMLLVSAVVFLGLSFAIHQPGVEELDLRFTHWVQGFHNRAATAVMAAFSFLGNTLTLIVQAALVLVWLTRRGMPMAGWLSVISLLGLLLNVLLKEIVGRPRPDGSLVSVLLPTVGLSFPSGHAMAAMMFYGFLAVLAWMHVRDKRLRWKATFALIAVAFLVSFSRIYVGAHWLSDVVGGWTAGLFCLLLLVEAYKHWGAGELSLRTAIEDAKDGPA